MKPVDRVLERLEGVSREGDGSYAALCPAHRDGEPSLSVSEGDDCRVLLKCFAGCTVQEITGALGLEMSDLFERRNGRGGGGASIPPRSLATVQPCTLEAYAEKTKLPVGFLRNLNLSDLSYMGTPAVSGGARAPSPACTASGGSSKPGRPGTSFWSRARAIATPCGITGSPPWGFPARATGARSGLQSWTASRRYTPWWSPTRGARPCGSGSRPRPFARDSTG